MNKSFGRKNKKPLFILTFKYECKYDKDEVSFALTEPYDYDRL
jgi:hypothetical protein